MPYRLYLEGEILRIDFSAAVTVEDMGELAKAVREFECRGPVVPHRIVDLTHTSGTNFKYPFIAGIAEQRKAIKFPHAFKSAIVAPKPVHVGLARMFATLNDHPQITIRIFPDLDSAKAWIAEP